MGWPFSGGKKNLAASVQVQKLVTELKNIEKEVDANVSGESAAKAIKEFTLSAQKVSAQARVCLYVTHTCLQSSEEILPLLKEFERLNTRVDNKKKMDSISYVNEQAAEESGWNYLTNKFREFNLHSRRFSPQDFLNHYGQSQFSTVIDGEDPALIVFHQFEKDFAAKINNGKVHINQQGNLASGYSKKDQLMNTRGQSIREILDDEKKLEDWFELLSVEMTNLGSLHAGMNKASVEIGGLSGKMGDLAKNATAAAAAAVESSESIQEYAKNVLDLQNNLTNSMDKLHNTGVVKLENGELVKHENPVLTNDQRQGAMR